MLMASTLAPGLLRLTPTVPSSLRLSVRCHVATLPGRHLFVGIWIMMAGIVSSASKHVPGPGNSDFSVAPPTVSSWRPQE